LGADNGIGIAATLAVLESDTIGHGPLEALFTISEETGMDGAFGLEPETLKGEILLNLDSEEEGELFIGCAGGVDVNIEASYEEEKVEGKPCIRITVSGLKGGHSGLDINLGRANSNLVLAGLISDLAEKIDLHIHAFSGGNLRNAIPRESEALLAVKPEDMETFRGVFRELADQAGEKFKKTDPEMQITYQENGIAGTHMMEDYQGRILDLLLRTPSGVLKMSDQMPGIVQTSNNMAIISMERGKLEIKMLLRSSSDEEKDQYAQSIQQLYKEINANTGLSGAYPGWLPNADSGILKHAKTIYQELFAKAAKVQVIHAGLECGIIGGTYPNLDMISFGPTIKFPHSPDEKVHIHSVGHFWEFLVAVLEAI
jgi:dipeptidase D